MVSAMTTPAMPERGKLSYSLAQPLIVGVPTRRQVLVLSERPPAGAGAVWRGWNDGPMSAESTQLEAASPCSPTCGLLVSAAEGAERVRPGFVEPALAAGWSVAVTLTPAAATWLDHDQELDTLRELTAHPVRTQPRMPDEPRPHPPIDVYAIVPASANTVAKLALGIADNQMLTAAAEAVGDPRVPVVAFPGINAAHARHPQWDQHLATLRSADVRLVYGPEVWPLHEPSGAPQRDLPWEAILAAVTDAYARGA